MEHEFATYPSLRGRSVLITGGASGIGAAMVQAFAAQGARVGFIDRDEKAAQSLTETHPGVAMALADLCDISQLRLAIARLREQLGPVEVLVNNAARDDRHDWRDITPEYWDERMQTNLRHMFFAAQAVAPDMTSAGRGAIINMGSNSWHQASGGFAAYTTAKAAVHGLTRSLARDFGRYRIRVNTVVPGWVMTERQKELWVTPEALEAHLERQCLPDLIEPVFVARMVLFLASNDALMCTANNYMVEAGSI